MIQNLRAGETIWVSAEGLGRRAGLDISGQRIISWGGGGYNTILKLNIFYEIIVFPRSSGGYKGGYWSYLSPLESWG